MSLKLADNLIEYSITNNINLLNKDKKFLKTHYSDLILIKKISFFYNKQYDSQEI